MRFVIFYFLLKCLKVFAEDLYVVNGILPWYRRLFCFGIPILHFEPIPLTENAVKEYYRKFLINRLKEDKELEENVPPSSILSVKQYYEKIFTIYREIDGDWDTNLFFSQFNCDLHSDLDWVNTVFNKKFKRNSRVMRLAIDIIFRFTLCLKKIDSYMNCPSNCRFNGKKFCQGFPNSNGKCIELDNKILSFDTNKEFEDGKNELRPEFYSFYQKISKHHQISIEFFKAAKKSRIKDLFENLVLYQIDLTKDTRCDCSMYYKYDSLTKECKSFEEILACRGIEHCYNGGTCIPIPVDDGDTLLSKTFKCECKPAFDDGDTCAFEKDPCELEKYQTKVKEICGDFRCIRDPDNELLGFRCLCGKDFEPRGPLNPECLPVEACKKKPCLAGGRCIQGTPDVTTYRCDCPAGFSGERCEIFPPQSKWADWSPWSSCIWPNLENACIEEPYQISNRKCKVYSVGQVCFGFSKISKTGKCDPFKPDPVTIGKLADSEFKNAYINSLENCTRMSGIPSRSATIEEQGIEGVVSMLDIDYYTPWGDESPDLIVMPERFKNGEPINVSRLIEKPNFKIAFFTMAWFFIVGINFILMGICFLKLYQSIKVGDDFFIEK